MSRYGVLGHGKKSQIKKSYRALTSETLLTQLSPKDAPERPEMLLQKASKLKREWLLVPKDEYQELNKLENILKKEYSQISAQASLTVNRVGVSVIGK